ncbi:hypothetical protein ACHQM5_015311 [Ranunculus cassubicifolius]
MLQKMSLDDACNTHLGLCLGSHGLSENASKPIFQERKSCLKIDSLPSSFETSLTLGLPNETILVMEESVDLHHQGSANSDLSSFSDIVKRERDLENEEVMEVEKVYKRGISDEDEESNVRKKLRLTKEQSALLEDSFKKNNTLNPKQKQALARHLNLRPRQVEVWFQNRRARTKLKQTEVDCEYLKKYCEALTFENKRLQKEVFELKALKVTPPVCMQLPAATLTMCPSCERIGGVGDGGIYNNLTSKMISYTVSKQSS